MGQNTYKIIITNQLNADQDKASVIRKLAILFKLSEERATRLLSRPETTIKEHLDETSAKKYQLAISKTGAHSQIINTAVEDDLDLPETVTRCSLNSILCLPLISSTSGRKTI